MKPRELRDRTRKFSVVVIKLVQRLPKTHAGEAVAAPLARCGTAVGSCYRAACRSRNVWDFSTRMHTVEEAADESLYWFRVILEADMLPARDVQPVVEECEALKQIFTKSCRVAKRHVRERYRPGGPHDSGVDDEDIPF